MKTVTTNFDDSATISANFDLLWIFWYRPVGPMRRRACSVDHKSGAVDGVGTCEFCSQVPTTLCVVPVTCNNNMPAVYYNMADFVDKFAEFVPFRDHSKLLCSTIPTQ